jgi:hypothetical protein
MAVGAGGAAVVTYGVVYNAGVPIGPQFTSRMSPTGIWGAPVRQPEGPPFGLSGAVAMDAKGRALIAGWDGTDLMGRRSRPHSRWRKPFIVAEMHSWFGVRRRGGGTVGSISVGRTAVDEAGHGDAGRQRTAVVERCYRGMRTLRRCLDDAQRTSDPGPAGHPHALTVGQQHPTGQR